MGPFKDSAWRHWWLGLHLDRYSGCIIHRGESSAICMLLDSNCDAKAGRENASGIPQTPDLKEQKVSKWRP